MYSGMVDDVKSWYQSSIALTKSKKIKDDELNIKKELNSRSITPDRFVELNKELHPAEFYNFFSRIVTYARTF